MLAIVVFQLLRLGQKFAMPVLMDELQLVGEQLGIQREGEVFVIEPKTGFKVAYHGPVSQTAKAIDAVLAGKPVANPRVAYRKKAEKKAKARIGQSAPMRTGEKDAYGGEATGIRSNISRSRLIKG